MADGDLSLFTSPQLLTVKGMVLTASPDNKTKKKLKAVYKQHSTVKKPHVVIVVVLH